MIVKEVIDSSDKAYFVIPQDADDLFSLRRITEKPATMWLQTQPV